MSSLLSARRPRTLGPLLGLTLTLSACQPPVPDEQEAIGALAQRAAEAAAKPAPATAAQAPPIGSCDASQVQSLLGQTLTEQLSTQAQRDTGAARVRILKPGQPVTMEFDGERLSIDVDQQHRITGVRCG